MPVDRSPDDRYPPLGSPSPRHGERCACYDCVQIKPHAPSCSCKTCHPCGTCVAWRRVVGVAGICEVGEPPFAVQDKTPHCWGYKRRQPKQAHDWVTSATRYTCRRCGLVTFMPALCDDADKAGCRPKEKPDA